MNGLPVIRRGDHPHQLVLEAAVNFREVTEGRGKGVCIRQEVCLVCSIGALEGQHAFQGLGVLEECSVIQAGGSTAAEGRPRLVFHGSDAGHNPAHVPRIQSQLFCCLGVDHEGEVNHQQCSPYLGQLWVLAGSDSFCCSYAWAVREVQGSEPATALAVRIDQLQVLHMRPEDALVASVAPCPPEAVPGGKIRGGAREQLCILDIVIRGF
mmetsp:Transcript_71777/g.149957  ORF Transcript_71777/g.149957 Transcript_71777/m.149957 type:complete len:210 (+) Transcript_71777:2206-2835(+)